MKLVKSDQDELMWIGGYCALPLACLILSVLFLSGCSGIQRTPPIEVWPDMKRQPKLLPQDSTGLFSDGRAGRVPPEGTIARGHMTEQTAYFTGMDGELYTGKNPVATTPELLRLGQTRFNIYCQPCHDKTGTGQGVVPARVPTWQPQNLTEDRIVQAADGDIFNVITNGRRSMPPYKFQISVEDRWAIIAYVRILQRAAHATMSDVPAGKQSELP